jgi:putative two-component system response regulator
MTRPDSRSRQVPTRALVISLAALLFPAVAPFVVPEALSRYAPFFWLLALLPAFLLAYYRGWRGVATALAAGMATLSLAQAVSLWMGRSVPDLLFAVVIAYLVIALGIGWLAEVLHRDRDEVEDMAFTDILTHLPNRRHARVFLENEFAAAQRGRLLAVVLFDLDHFKRYNDSYGHQAGDEALEEFARVLARTTRRMNLSSRFGGEEFVSVLAGSDADGSAIFADRVRMALRALSLGDQPLTVSAGVASYHPSMRSPDELLAAADHALYQAKHEGRNCVRIFGRTGLEAVDEARGRGLAAGEAGAARAGAAAAGPQPPPQQITGFGQNRTLLVVEDDRQVRELLATYLEREGFAVSQAASVALGVRALREEFDGVITDIRLPGAGGNEMVAAVKSRWPSTQVIVITGLQDAQTAADALNAGADRYLFKPFGMPELRSHLVDALVRRDRALAERAQRPPPDPAADQRDVRVREAVLRGARALVRAVEARDPFTAGHSERVSAYADILADGIDPDGELLDRDSLRLACELHDVGKIGVPDVVLNKESDLTTEEFAAVKEAPRTGRRILGPLLEDDLILAIVSWHHESWDGNGYPDGLSGETIPLGARVVGLADALDAITSPRAYRPARPWEIALTQIRERSGGQFDPAVVEVFESALGRLREAYDRLTSEPVTAGGPATGDPGIT